jgi:hypothetical protein
MIKIMEGCAVHVETTQNGKFKRRAVEISSVAGAATALLQMIDECAAPKTTTAD